MVVSGVPRIYNEIAQILLRYLDQRTFQFGAVTLGDREGIYNESIMILARCRRSPAWNSKYLEMRFMTKPKECSTGE